jgi:hypothetical protein
VRELEGTLEDIGAKDRGLPTRARSVGLSNTGGGSSGGTADVPAGAVAELKQKISELQSQIQVEAEKGSSARAIADNRLTDLEQKVSQVLPSPGNSPMAGGFLNLCKWQARCTATSSYSGKHVKHCSCQQALVGNSVVPWHRDDTTT